MSAVQSRDCLTIILGILTRTLESCYRKYEVAANPYILVLDGEKLLFY